MNQKQLTAFVKEMMASSDKFKAAGTSLEVLRNPNKYIKGFTVNKGAFELEDIINNPDGADLQSVH